MDSFWDWVWFAVIIFFFTMYLIILFQVVIDIFRSHDMSGWVKALWFIALLFVPFLTLLIYVIVRGPKMAQNRMAEAADLQARQDAYIKQVAGSSGAAASPAEQIAKAQELLNSGAISQEEFNALKAKALA